MHVNFINGITPEIKVKKEPVCCCGATTIGTRHHLTKWHTMKVKELEQQEEEDRLQEVEDIKEQEIRDNNAEVETWKTEDLQREKEKAEEDARLDAEFEIWNEAQQACRRGYKNRGEERMQQMQDFIQKSEWKDMVHIVKVKLGF